jgi:signal transduction histidine kinase
VSRKSPKRLRTLYPKISTRVTLPFLLALIVIAVIGAYIVTRLVGSNIQERLDAQLSDSAQSAAATLDEIERGTLAVIRLMTFTEGIAEAVSTRDSAAIDRLLSSVAGNEGVDDLIVFDAAGDPIYRFNRASAGAVAALPDTRTWPSVSRVLRGEVDPVGDKFVDLQAAGEPGSDAREFTFYTSGAIRGDDDALVGGLLVGMTSRRLVLTLKEQAVASIVLLTRDGAVMRTSFLGDQGAQFALDAPRLAQMEADALAETPTWYSPRYTVEGAEYQFILVPLTLRETQLGWMSLGLRVDFINERVDSSRDLFVGFFMVMLVIVVLIGVFVSGSIIRPIFRLLDTTRAIRSGDLSRRANLKIPDELGELSQSFDHMTAELIKRNREINNLYAAQLKETVQREAVLTSISDAVIVVDTTYRPILVNTAARALQKGVPSRADFRALFSDPLDYAEPRNLVIGGRHFSALSTPVQLPSGETLGYVIVFRDITSLIEAERVKDEVILQLSHELRTPLTAAKGYVELVRMLGAETLPDMHIDFLGKAHAQIKTLSGMIDQVVEVNSIMANRFSVELRPLDLNPLLDEIGEAYRERAESGGYTYIVTLPDFPVWVEGDSVRLTAVVQNVLNNAFNYTLPGGWIELYLEIDEDGRAVITVHDSGVGIGEDEVDKVFEKLYRGRSAEAGPTDTRGMGLGLYISRQIVTAHHGTINLSSTLNVGTTVVILLPLGEKMVLPHDRNTDRDASGQINREEEII